MKKVLAGRYSGFGRAKLPGVTLEWTHSVARIAGYRVSSLLPREHRARMAPFHAAAPIRNIA